MILKVSILKMSKDLSMIGKVEQGYYYKRTVLRVLSRGTRVSVTD